MLTFERVKEIVSNIKVPNFEFLVMPKGDGFLLQLAFWAEDVDATEPGNLILHKSRKWYMSAHSTESEVVETAWAALQRTVLHEAAETFLYKGRRVFSPHFDVNARIHMVDENRYDIRK